jgi:hypothetical protein
MNNVGFGYDHHWDLAQKVMAKPTAAAAIAKLICLHM